MTILPANNGETLYPTTILDLIVATSGTEEVAKIIIDDSMSNAFGLSADSADMGVRIFNLLPSKETLYINRPDGLQFPVEYFNHRKSTEMERHSLKLWRAGADKISSLGGIVVEVTGADFNRDQIAAIKDLPFRVLDPYDAQSKTHPALHAKRRYAYYILVTLDDLVANPCGVHIPQVGFTVGLDPSALKNQHLSLYHLNEENLPGVRGVRYRLSCVEGEVKTLFVNLGGKIVPIRSTHGHHTKAGTKIEVFYTTERGERLANVLSLSQALEGNLIETPDGPFQVKLFASEEEATAAILTPTKRVTELEEEITKLNEAHAKEVKELNRAHKTGFFGKAVGYLKDIFKPVITLAAVIATFVAAA